MQTGPPAPLLETSQEQRKAGGGGGQHHPSEALPNTVERFIL